MGFRLALCTLILDDLELAFCKVNKLNIKYCNNGDRHNDWPTMAYFGFARLLLFWILIDISMRHEDRGLSHQHPV